MSEKNIATSFEVLDRFFSSRRVYLNLKPFVQSVGGSLSCGRLVRDLHKSTADATKIACYGNTRSFASEKRQYLSAVKIFGQSMGAWVEDIEMGIDSDFVPDDSDFVPDDSDFVPDDSDEDC